MEAKECMSMNKLSVLQEKVINGKWGSTAWRRSPINVLPCSFDPINKATKLLMASLQPAVVPKPTDSHEKAT